MSKRRPNAAISTSSSSTTTPPPPSISLSKPAKARLSREISRLTTDPPPGIAAYLPNLSNMSHIHAQITGPPSSPFSDGIFLLTITITPRYPFEPPRCRFLTPLYHPNIDSAGRICLDTLKSPPAGSWSPAVSLPSLLLSLRALMAEPNPDDGLVPEISDLYKRRPGVWREEARRRTLREATSEKVTEMEAKIMGGGDGEGETVVKKAKVEVGTDESDKLKSQETTSGDRVVETKSESSSTKALKKSES